jgi:hypothetical protein
MQHDSANFQEFVFVQVPKTQGAANSAVLLFCIVTAGRVIDDPRSVKRSDSGIFVSIDL